MVPKVDVVVLTRHAGPLRPEVEHGLRIQRGVQIVVHRVVGQMLPQDRCRYETIARMRNEGKLRGTTPWLMFVDDDVVLEPHCICALVDELRKRPAFAALAADYLGEHCQGKIAPHVSTGATLFRREPLQQIRFNWRETQCDCQRCCEDLRRLHWAIDYWPAAKARHLPKGEVSQNSLAGQKNGDQSIVTCMCVTHRRVRLLRRSIQCFLNQTYPNRELVVIYQSDDEETRQFLAEVRGSSILPIEVPAIPCLSLGSLRNIGRQAGNGTYIAHWDDDDWHSPTRLGDQMRTIRDTGKRVCLLSRVTLYDCLAKCAYVSSARPWENTLVAERTILPPYPDVAKCEDTPVVDDLIRHGDHILLDRPELYIYTYHGRNTWDRLHWDQIVRRGRPLDDRTSGLMSSLLGIDVRPAAQSQTFISR